MVGNADRFYARLRWKSWCKMRQRATELDRVSNWWRTWIMGLKGPAFSFIWALTKALLMTSPCCGLFFCNGLVASTGDAWYGNCIRPKLPAGVRDLQTGSPLSSHTDGVSTVACWVQGRPAAAGLSELEQPREDVKDVGSGEDLCGPVGISWESFNGGDVNLRREMQPEIHLDESVRGRLFEADS